MLAQFLRQVEPRARGFPLDGAPVSEVLAQGSGNVFDVPGGRRQGA
ncbi:MAG: hypothetical protein AAB211_03210 [Pseudomonadota bacterium]